VQDLARSLVLLAVAQGGSDNATLVAAAVPSAEADLGMSDPGRHITSEFPLP
jgi:serine/threonine protein phosphatase PrpC